MRCLLVALLALALAPPAAAAPFNFVEGEHLSIALAWWGPLPCASVSYRVESDDWVDAHHLGALGLAWYRRRHGFCAVVLAKRVREEMYAGRCAILLHEVGHLQERGHSKDKTDPMYESYYDLDRYPAACRRGARRRQRGCNRKRSERAVERCYARWSLE